MGQTRLESVKSLDRWLFDEYTRLLRRFNFLSEETIVEFEHNKPSVVFYAGPQPAVGGENQLIASYNIHTNSIFANIELLISDRKPPSELKAAEEKIKQAGLIYKVGYARGKFHELTHALISSLSYNKDFNEFDKQSDVSLLFSLVKNEALAEGVADLFLKQLGEPYSNTEIAQFLREVTKDSLKSRLDSIVDEKSENVVQIVSHDLATALRYRGPNELRSVLRKPIEDRINKREEAVYQELLKQWKEWRKTCSPTKSGG